MHARKKQCFPTMGTSAKNKVRKGVGPECVLRAAWMRGAKSSSKG